MTVRRTLLAGPRFYQAPADPEAAPLPVGVHVVRGDSPGGALLAAGAKRVVAVPDNLAIGPSSRSRRLHPKIRERFWRTQYAAARRPLEGDGGALELLRADEVAARAAAIGAGRIYLWCSGFWSDLLFLGWLLQAAGASDAWERPFIAGNLRTTMPLGWWNPNQLAPLARDAQELMPQLRLALDEVWRAFTDRTPERLDHLRQSPLASLPTLVEGLAAYAALLPRRLLKARRLRLAAVDEVLFRVIPSARWVRFPDLFKGTSPSRARWPKAGLFAMLDHFGEVFIESRIASWAVGANPAIHQIASRDVATPYTASWRLTERGRALLAGGIDGPEDCPELTVGGYVAGRNEDWCCAIGNGGWRFERWA